MRILIIGGTRLLGRAIVQSALKHGHELTLFNRGISNPELFPEVEKIHGDRGKDVGLLAGRRWDAVIDVSGYFPSHVRQSAQTLAHQVDTYCYVSTLSVYADFSAPGKDENAPLAQLDPSHFNDEEIGENYGGLKVMCEQEVQRIYPGRCFIPRPGLIVGPHDHTDRFTYWPHRVAQGGEVLAPGKPGEGVSFIDVRDLGEWIVKMVEQKAAGAYNATGPDQPVPLDKLLEVCRTESGSNATFTWVPEDFLLAQGVTPWDNLPMWVPQGDPAWTGFHHFDLSKAVASGLTFRPLAETVRDTLAFDASRPADYKFKAGMSREREREILEAWKKSNG